ncbi:copper transporter [Actinomyces timonensis]|uniref:copper transporter n=1 Tax=Actinomyces timonensis TaxID=1288391 RepID=UPI0002DD5679|nr:copper transporter [Actinomyces timonensis]
MIDFRYHLVSLISVFLALAVGIVLGAGPLQNSLGDALHNQVESLREDRNAAHAQLETASAALNDRDAYITAAASSYLPGTLSGRSIAIVSLPDAQDEDVELVISQIEAAGGKTVGRVTLTSVWTDPDRESFRSTYSGQFAGNIGQPVSSDANGILGEGLAKTLTTEGPSATALRDLLTASDTPLMTVDSQLTAKADAVVVVGPRSAQSNAAGATPTPGADATGKAWASALNGVAAGGSAVIVGGADDELDIISVMREAKTKATTIDSVGQASAAVSVPLALAAVLAGTQGAYGFDDGATAVMPPIPSKG